MHNIYGGYIIKVSGISIELAVGIADKNQAIGQAETLSLMRPNREHFIIDATSGEVVACVINRRVSKPVYLVVNGNTGCNLTKKNSRGAAENAAMRWRRALAALDIPVYVMNSLTGEIVYEAL